jgi:nitrogen fixation/metabolism regulation signal transduction histidine kinase
MEVAYEIHLWFIVLMAGAVALAVLVAVVTAILAARQRNR